LRRNIDQRTRRGIVPNCDPGLLLFKKEPTREKGHEATWGAGTSRVALKEAGRFCRLKEPMGF
jgi:hypothetical protein